jgi:hypothetical protein
MNFPITLNFDFFLHSGVSFSFMPLCGGFAKFALAKRTKARLENRQIPR